MPSTCLILAVSGCSLKASMRLYILLTLLLATATSTPSTPPPHHQRQLASGNLIVVYVEACETNNGEEAIAEARAGANVLIWSFISDLTVDTNTSDPIVDFSLNPDCIASVAKQLVDEGLPTTHLVS